MAVGLYQTKKELDSLVRDFRSFTNVFRFVTVGVYLAYVIYRLVVRSGILPVNIVLLVATVAYIIALIAFTVRHKKSGKAHVAKPVVDKAYRYLRFAGAAFSSVIAILGILTAVEGQSAISVVLAILMPVFLVLQLVFDVFIVVISVRVARFKAALSDDVERLKKDMVKIALDFVKSSLFRKEDKKGKEKIEEGEESDIIIVGSDEPVSVKMMKSVTSGAKKTGFFAKFFSGGKKADNRAAEEEGVEEREEKNN